ncbi:PBP1A family penicillin-binding protein [Roseomonas sp. KE2513]|nr:PBP1A family penicillin-binding protein [Roseomonas sp. KE2513]
MGGPGELRPDRANRLVEDRSIDPGGKAPRGRRFQQLVRPLGAPIRFLVRPVTLLALASAGLAVGCVFVGWTLLRLPVDGGMVADPGTGGSLVLEAADGEAFAARGVLRGDAITADRLPRRLADAVIAIEDRRFYEHGGIDPRGVLRAALRNATAGRTREGASTITQQLARLLYLSQERTLARKAQELLIAVWLERQLSKDEILARYLSSAYFGAGAWGADAAARRYFGKAAGDLSLAEAAMLAGLVRAPSQLAPTRNPEGARQRAGLVLTAMVETGRATQADAAAARDAPVALRTPPEMVPGRGYFADWVEAETRRQVGPVPVDVMVRTTLDPALQDIAERVVGSALDREGTRAKVGQAALVALSHDGAVLAAVGGRDYGASQFNRVTQARRQPGSLFKLFVYGAALEAGWQPDTSVVDQPVRIGTWEPQNFGGRYRGRTTLRDAFAQSINTVAVQVSEAVGRNRVIEVAKRLGVRSELASVPSIALGSTEVTLLEMAGAFAGVASGSRVEPYVLRAVRARDRPLYSRAEPGIGGGQTAPVLTPAARAGLLDLLLAVVRDGTGRAAQLPRPVAGKTGTTQDNRDAWFVGFTADVVVAVWVGNDDNTPTNNVTGGTLPANIWRAFVSEADRVKTATAQAAAVARPVPPGAAGRPPQATAPSAPPAMPPRPAVRGQAVVLDTGTLRVAGQVVRLGGVIGFSGEPARDMALYLAGREVICEPADAGTHRCKVGDRDLSEVVLFNGGGRAARDAEASLQRAEDQAREASRGLWAAW